MSRDTINLPDNLIQDGIAKYTTEHQDLLLWSVGYARSELGGSRSRLCELIECDWTTLWRILAGRYEASPAALCERIADLQRRVSESTHTGFVETPVTRRIHELLDYALAGDVRGGRIVMVAGPTGRSKSEAVQEWCRRNNHGRSIYIDCPESGGLKTLLCEIADKVGVNVSRPTLEIRDRVISSFSRRRILIVDEVFRLLPSRRGGRHPTELEFLRRLHDVRHCPIALVATQAFVEEMNVGTLRSYLEQLLGRIVDPLVIPQKTFRTEVRAICEAFAKGDPPDELVSLAHAISNQPGRLRVLFELLRQAAAISAKKKEPLAERHLAVAAERRKGRFAWQGVD